MNFDEKGKWRIASGVMGILLLVMGCAGKQRRHPLVTLAGESRPVCKIAVLPFQNQTKFSAAGLILYRIVMAEMANRGDFQIVEEGIVRRILLQGKVYPGQAIGIEIRKMIVEATGVEAFLSGEVEEAIEEKDRVHLAFRMRVQEAKTGRLLWTTYYARSGNEYRTVMHFGKIDTLTGLARQMVEDVLLTWQGKGLGGCGG